MSKVVVTTGDVKRDYEILGPVYYQINNRPIGFSGKNKLSAKVKEYQELAQKNKEKTESAPGLMYALFMPISEFGPGENMFRTAFYIAVEELKKQAEEMGGDAVVAMRQDIDIDSNGFQYFFLQMYGTAVKYVDDSAAESARLDEISPKEPARLVEEVSKEVSETVEISGPVTASVAPDAGLFKRPAEPYAGSAACDLLSSKKLSPPERCFK